MERDTTEGGMVGDVLRGRKPRRTRPFQDRRTLTIRLPASVLADVGCAAAARGITLTDIVEEAVTRCNVRPTRSRAIGDAKVYTDVGYRLARALVALDAGNASEVREHLNVARAAVFHELLKIREEYDADLDSAGAKDAWVSVDQPYRGRGLTR